jgi:amino acid permease
VAALGIIASWAFIVVCQMRLRKAIKEGKAADVSFKLPGAPVTSWLTLLFLFSVLVLMAFDYPNGTYTIATIPLLAVLLIAGWFGVRKRVHEIHSTAPVHPTMKNTTHRWWKKPRVKSKREGKCLPFLSQRDTNYVVRLGGFLLASGFLFHRHVQGFAIRRERQAVRVDRRVEGFVTL